MQAELNGLERKRAGGGPALLPAAHREAINGMNGSKKEYARTYNATQNTGMVADANRNPGVLGVYK